MTRQREIDLETIRADAAADDGAIDFLEAAGLEGGHEPMVGEIIFGNDQTATGVLVEAMNDAGAFHPADAGERPAAVCEQGIDEGVLPISRAGMNDHARVFIDDNQITVLVENLQRNGLRRHGKGFRIRNPGGDSVPDGNHLTGHTRLAVECDEALFDAFLQIGTGMRHVRGEE